MESKNNDILPTSDIRNEIKTLQKNEAQDDDLIKTLKLRNKSVENQINAQNSTLKELLANISEIEQELELERFAKTEIINTLSKLRQYFNESIEPINSISNTLNAIRLTQEDVNQSILEEKLYQEEQERSITAQVNELNETCSQLSKKTEDFVKVFDEDLQRKKLKKEENRNIINIMETQIAELEAALKGDKLKLQEVKTNIEKYNNDIQLLEDERKQKEIEKDNLTKSIEKSESLFENEMSDLNFALEEMKDNLQQTNNEILTMQKQLNDQRNYNEPLQQKIDHNLREIENLTEKKSQMKSNLIKYQEERDSKDTLSRNEITELINKRDIKEAIYNDLQSNKVKFKERLTNIVHDIDITIANNKQIKNDTNELKLKLDKIIEENNSIKKENEILQKEYNAENMNVCTLKVQLEYENLHFKEAEESLQNRIKNAQKDISDYKDDMENRIQETTEKLHLCNKTLNEQKEKIIADNENELSHLETNLKLIEKETSDLATDNAKELRRLRSITIECDVITKELKDIRNSNTELKEKLAKKTTNGKDLKSSGASTTRRAKTFDTFDDMSVSSTEGISNPEVIDRRRAKRIKKML